MIHCLQTQLLLAHLYKCSTPGIGASLSISKMSKFYVEVFYVIGKALSGDLSCLQTGLTVY